MAFKPRTRTDSVSGLKSGRLIIYKYLFWLKRRWRWLAVCLMGSLLKGVASVKHIARAELSVAHSHLVGLVPHPFFDCV